MNRDTATTAAGGLMGFQILTSVDYASISHGDWGQLVKILVGFMAIGVGYFLYRDKPPSAQAGS